MTTSLDVSGWAGDIIEFMDLMSGVTTGSVSLWLMGNVGTLNLAIDEAFSTSGTNAIIPEMDLGVMAIYTKMYECYYMKKTATQQLHLTKGAGAWIAIEGTEEQGAIKRVSGVELARLYKSLFNDCQAELKDMLDWYNQGGGNGYSNLPHQVLYDHNSYFATSVPNVFTRYNFLSY
jgi:hypothetical protein